MRAVVTGAGGFIGSHVAEALAGAGHEVLAVDALDRATDPRAAARNWAALAGRPLIDRLVRDLVTDDLTPLARADVVVHLAGRPGIRDSWGDPDATRRDNVDATRRLLAACDRAQRRPRVVVASSSSVYGETAGPCAEDARLDPRSPYAQAKVDVEGLAAPAASPTVVLRYFSVYGPRQRADMAFHRFIEAALSGEPMPVLGDGRQCRSFTSVDDVVDATVRAATRALPRGSVINVGHRSSVPVAAAVERIAALVGADARPRFGSPVAGEARRTWADPDRAAALLGWTARTALAVGLARQLAWHRGRRLGKAA